MLARLKTNRSVDTDVRTTNNKRREILGPLQRGLTGKEWMGDRTPEEAQGVVAEEEEEKKEKETTPPAVSK